jgi:pimeloyl-ACP methyl ester carboxylesterase
VGLESFLAGREFDHGASRAAGVGERGRHQRSADGTSIAFERAGAGHTIVLVDAAGCFRGFGPTAPLVPALSGNFTVVSYDRRGRGESTDTLPYSVDREVEHSDGDPVVRPAGT